MNSSLSNINNRQIEHILILIMYKRNRVLAIQGSILDSFIHLDNNSTLYITLLLTWNVDHHVFNKMAQGKV